jgi:hypothetical protein
MMGINWEIVKKKERDLEIKTGKDLDLRKGTKKLTVLRKVIN